MNESIDVLSIILAIFEIASEIIILSLPWMILAAINSVRSAIEKASQNRSYETKLVVKAIKDLRNDLLRMCGRGDEIEP